MGVSRAVTVEGHGLTRTFHVVGKDAWLGRHRFDKNCSEKLSVPLNAQAYWEPRR